MISMLSSWTGFFNVFSFIGDILGAILKGVLFLPMILIFIGVMAVAYFSEIIFKKLAGIDPIYLDGRQLTGASGDGKDLVYGFITDTAVQNVFWSIVALSIVLLFICTIIALIKSEFTLDLKGSAKGPIIGRAFKSLVNFITIPIVTIIAILGTNFLTKSIFDMFGGEDNNIVTKCFYVGAYNANRARLNPNFATDLANNSWSAFDTKDPMFDGTNPFTGKSQAEVADMIDDYFMTGKEIQLQYVKTSIWERITDGDLNDGMNEIINGGYVNWSLIFFGYPENDGVMKFTDFVELNYYYDLAKFDYILSVGSAVAMIWLLLSVGLVLMKRVFELTILFLLAPAMTAIAPLDGGQAEKKWRGEFMKRLLAVIGPIFAYNMYFLLVPLFESISLFGLTNNGLQISASMGNSNTMLGSVVLIFAAFFTVFDVFFQIVCIFVGLSIVKSASALLSSLLGIDDLVKSGAENAKKAVDLGKKAALGATAITGMAVKGTAVRLKKMKASLPSKGKKSAKQAKEELGDAKKDLKEADKNVEDSEKEIKASTDKIEEVKSTIMGTNKYKAADAKVQRLEKKRMEDDNWNEDDEKELAQSIKDRDDIISNNDGLKNLESKKKAAESARDSAIEDRNQKAAVVDRRERGISSDLEKDLLDEKGNMRTDLSKKEQKILDSASLGATNKERRAAAKELETGKDSKETSSIGRTFDKLSKNKIYKNTIGKSNVFDQSIQQWLNPAENEAVKRRLNDGLAGMFGEGGGGELWKIWFNKNARANLYEGVPESKKRTAGIEQDLSWTAKAGVDEKLASKRAREEEEKQIRRMIVDKRKDEGGKYSELVDLYDQLEKESNPKKIESLQADVKKLEMQTGITSEARKYYDKATSGNDMGEEIAKYKKYLSDKGVRDAVASEIDKKQKAEKAYSEVTGKPLETTVGNKDGKALKVDMDNKSSKQISDAIVAGLKSSFASIVQAIEKSNGNAEEIKKAIERLKEIFEKKGE